MSRSEERIAYMKGLSDREFLSYVGNLSEDYSFVEKDYIYKRIRIIHIRNQQYHEPYLSKLQQEKLKEWERKDNRKGCLELFLAFAGLGLIIGLISLIARIIWHGGDLINAPDAYELFESIQGWVIMLIVGSIIIFFIFRRKKK